MGRFAIGNSVLCTIWPVPCDAEQEALTTELALKSVLVGHTRTMTQDVTYGVRMLADGTCM